MPEWEGYAVLRIFAIPIKAGFVTLFLSVGFATSVAAGQLEDGLVAYDRGDYSAALQNLLPLAQAGNTDALFTAGNMYEKGQGVVYDYAKALDLFGKAYAAGSYDALAEMGNMYRGGLGVDQDYAKAVAMFQEASQHGSLRGESYLGEAYSTGQGVQVDYQQARTLFEDAANRGLVAALVNIGNLYLAGRGVPRDIPTAVKYYSSAIEKNSAQAMNNLGLLWQKGQGVMQDQAGALNLFERAGMLGESSGAYNAGWAYENGIGITPDFVQAYRWYDIGANEGGTFSAHRRDLLAAQLTPDQIQQARNQEPFYSSASSASPTSVASGQSPVSETTGSFLDGRAAFNKNDYPRAMQIWRPLAEQGNAGAQAGLGVMYDQGLGVPQDYAAAAIWYQRAAAQGDDIAEFALGALYLFGEGVPKDEAVAAGWFRKSAEQGDPMAEDYLGYIYEKGYGVPQDYAEAEKWYGLAATTFSASDAGERDKAVSNRDRIAAILASQQSSAPIPASPQQGLKIAATGSGFYISNISLLLTNYHVVKDCKAVSTPGATVSVASVDPTNDLALLSAPPRSGGVAIFRMSPAVRAGERVVAVGFPLAGYLAEQANVTTGDVSSLAGIENDSRYLQITAAVQPGNSGGPLFDAAGNVIGVVSAKIDAIKVAGVTGDIPENVNFAINVSVVRAFLDSHGVAYQTAASTSERSPPDIGDTGKSITELVECWQ